MYRAVDIEKRSHYHLVTQSKPIDCLNSYTFVFEIFLDIDVPRFCVPFFQRFNWNVPNSSHRPLSSTWVSHQEQSHQQHQHRATSFLSSPCPAVIQTENICCLD